MKSIYVIIVVAILTGILMNFPDGIDKSEENNKVYFNPIKRELTEGVYRGTGEGFVGPIEVEVTFSREQSTSSVRARDIKIINHDEIKKYWKIVEDKVLTGLTEKDSSEIDALTGATKSVKGLLEAIEDAKEKSYRWNKSNPIR